MAYFWQDNRLGKSVWASFSNFLNCRFFLLAVFLLITWGWRFNLAVKEKRATLEQVRVEGILWEEPKNFYSVQSFWLKGYQIETLSDYSLSVGDRLILVGRVTCQATGKFQENCLINYPEISIKKSNFWSWLVKAVAKLRKRLIVSLEQVLPSESASLLTGIVWGNQGQFSKNFYNNLKKKHNFSKKV